MINELPCIMHFRMVSWLRKRLLKIFCPEAETASGPMKGGVMKKVLLVVPNSTIFILYVCSIYVKLPYPGISPFFYSII